MCGRFLFAVLLPSIKLGPPLFVRTGQVLQDGSSCLADGGGATGVVQRDQESTTPVGEVAIVAGKPSAAPDPPDITKPRERREPASESR